MFKAHGHQIIIRLFSLFLQARTRQSGGTIHTVNITKDRNLIHVIAVNVLLMKLLVVETDKKILSITSHHL